MPNDISVARSATDVLTCRKEAIEAKARFLHSCQESNGRMLCPIRRSFKIPSNDIIPSSLHCPLLAAIVEHAQMPKVSRKVQDMEDKMLFFMAS